MDLSNIKKVGGPQKLIIKKYRNIHVTQEWFKAKGMTKEDIRRKAQAISNTLKKNGWDGTLLVSFHLDDYKIWRAANGWTQAGNNVVLPQDYDGIGEPEKFTEFTIFYARNPPKGGKCDGKFGDCCYDCIEEVARERTPWDGPAAFKKFLGVARNAAVGEKSHYEKMDKKLTAVGFKLIVEGNDTYVSNSNGIPIHMLLSDPPTPSEWGHFSLNKSKVTKLRVRTAYKEKIPLIYRKQKEDYLVCDGNKTWTMTKKDFFNEKNNFIESIYVIIDDKKLETIEETKSKKLINLMDRHKEFTKNAEILKNETKNCGKYDVPTNLFKTGSFTIAALDYFEFHNRFTNPEIILQDEANLIEKGTAGALVRATPYVGELFKYDFVSRFASIMNDSRTFFPIKRGEWMTITELGTRLEYGLYFCKITGIDHRVFQENYDCVYTHYDIALAREHGYKIEMFNDSPNAFIYTQDKLIAGSKLFGKFVNRFFGLKKRKIGYAKDILTCLWGKLTERNKFVKRVKPSMEFEVPDNHTCHSIIPIGENSPDNPNNEYKVEYSNNECLFVTNYARIKPFLLARSRFLLSRVAKPIIDDVKRMHTDSIFSTKPLSEEHLKKYGVTLGDELGNLRYEGYCKNAEVINCSKTVTGKFKVEKILVKG